MELATPILFETNASFWYSLKKSGPFFYVLGGIESKY